MRTSGPIFGEGKATPGFSENEGEVRTCLKNVKKHLPGLRVVQSGTLNHLGGAQLWLGLVVSVP